MQITRLTAEKHRQKIIYTKEKTEMKANQKNETRTANESIDTARKNDSGSINQNNGTVRNNNVSAIYMVDKDGMLLTAREMAKVMAGRR